MNGEILAEARKDMLASLKELKSKVDAAIKDAAKEDFVSRARANLSAISDLAVVAQGSLPSYGLCRDVPTFSEMTNESNHEIAERMVQALIKMKVPGTKYLYLTEKNRRAIKRPVKRPVKKVAKKAKTKAKHK
jgi:hypothetical protein